MWNSECGQTFLILLALFRDIRYLQRFPSEVFLSRVSMVEEEKEECH